MRIWYLNLGLLDDKRLNAQHNEVEILFSCLKKGTDWGGHVKRFKSRAEFLKKIHDGTIFEKYLRVYDDGCTISPMDINDWKKIQDQHPTPFPSQLFENIKQEEYSFLPSPDSIIRDLNHLRTKWENELYYFGRGRLDITEHEKEYGIKPGRTLEECDAMFYLTRNLTRQYRDQFKTLKGRMQDKIIQFMQLNPKVKEGYFKILDSIKEGFWEKYGIQFHPQLKPHDIKRT